MLVQNKSSVEPRRKTTKKVYSTEKRNIISIYSQALIENKHSVYDYSNGQYHKSSLEKTKGNDILSRIRGKQLSFCLCSKCGFLKQMRIKKVSSVQSRFQKTYILGKDTHQYSHKQLQYLKKYSAYVNWKVKCNKLSLQKRGAYFLTSAANNYEFNMF